MEDPVKPCYAENPFHKQRKSTVFVEETDSDSKGVKRVIFKDKNNNYKGIQVSETVANILHPSPK